MKNLYNANGMPFWDEEEVMRRREIRDFLDSRMRRVYAQINPAIRVFECEAPTIMPLANMSSSYGLHDAWGIVPLGDEARQVMRPETTYGSYLYARHLLDSQVATPPLCVFQSGKSYRREGVHPTKFVRLAEFHQMEWQLVYTTDTANDYHAVVVPAVAKILSFLHGFPHRVVDSDRLPGYSTCTKDVEVEVDDRWLEIASISRRTDFPGKATFQTKKGVVEKDLAVVEVAIGLDRCVHTVMRWNESRLDEWDEPNEQA